MIIIVMLMMMITAMMMIITILKTRMAALAFVNTADYSDCVFHSQVGFQEQL